MIFEIDIYEEKVIKEWKAKQMLKDDTQYAAGERWGYKFIPTGLGMLIYVIDGKTGNELIVRGTENW
jgi:hypothetical protein